MRKCVVHAIEICRSERIAFVDIENIENLQNSNNLSTKILSLHKLNYHFLETFTLLNKSICNIFLFNWNFLYYTE